MDGLKSCPFCGNCMNGYPDYTVSFKRDKKKIYGVFHEICIIHCNKCGCTISQAGIDRETAERNAMTHWNRRYEVTE